STPTPSSTPSAPLRTAIGPASLVVPDGWTVREHLGSADGSGPIGRVWCLAEEGASDACAISVRLMAPSVNPLDSDTEGGYAADPMYCDPEAKYTRTVEDYRDVGVGGREGEYRRWHWACADGTSRDVAQYTVVTPSAWTVFSDMATEDTRAVMDRVVASLQLPPATSSVRLYDHGLVRSVGCTPTVCTLELDRTVPGMPNASTRTYEYHGDPDMTFGGGFVSPDPVGWPVVGPSVTIYTDGKRITSGFLTTD
ncbi:MAG: hypothetical protein IE926_18045, partial [Micrococcales bacterium]|nr:hypothetical protein [Micrococcales bacterium]